MFTPSIYDDNEENDDLIEYKLDYDKLDMEILKKIYVDTPLAVFVKDDKLLSTSSQPFVMAIMLRDANIGKNKKVLEIGSGSGFNAAIMANISGNDKNIVTTEINGDVASFAEENLIRAGYNDVKVLHKDGGRGYFEKSPYDSILITCGAPEIPLSDQLNIDGVISMPLVTRGLETLCSLTKKSDGSLNGYLSIFVRFLHFEGIYSDKLQFARQIAPLQRLVEKKAERDTVLERELSEFLVKDDDNISIKKQKRMNRNNFYFFLAISSEDAMVYNSDIEGHESGYALWHRDIKTINSGLTVLFPKEILSFGNQEVNEQLLAAYTKWKHLNKPGLKNYKIAFFPDKNIYTQSSENEWIVKRKKGITVFSVKL